MKKARWLACVWALGACSVMPAYEQPPAALDTSLSQAAGWHLAAGVTPASGRKAENIPAVGSSSVAASSVPVVGLLSGGPLFDDPVLDAMLQELSVQNLQVQQAAARLRQAEATLSGAGANRWPQLGVNLGGRRSGGSGANWSLTGSSGTSGGASSGVGAAANGTGSGAGATGSSQGSSSNSGPRNSFSAGASISWTPDLWGRVSAQVAASEASLAVAEADRQAVVLQMQLNLVQAYWRLRLAEARLALLARSIETAERSLQLTRNQYEAGLVARADVIQAETQWQGLVTQRHGLTRSRMIEQHAIAALLGKTPASFKLPVA
ncbi:MAG: TolC family protein, partial [Lautropia sp.]|nr:TolC family protein [Lautropia sp.]